MRLLLPPLPLRAPRSSQLRMRRMPRSAVVKSRFAKALVLRESIRELWADHLIYKIVDQAMPMADALTDGIVKQFPNKV